MPGPDLFGASTATRRPTQYRDGNPLRWLPHASGWRFQRLGLTGPLAAALLLAALTPLAQGQTGVTLAWDPSPGTNIAGYKLHCGAASRTYTNALNAGSATIATMASLIAGGTYYFAVTAYNTLGLESDFSNEVTYTNAVQAPPVIALTSPANGAVYTAPATLNLATAVTANGHTINEVQFYHGGTLLGSDATAPYSLWWNNMSSGAYSLSAKAIYDSGSVVASAPVSVTVTPGQPGGGITFAADSGVISGPFAVQNGTLSQSVTTGVADGGRAAYTFTIAKAGKYLVSARAMAPDTAGNSLFVNIDAEPTDPLMIWDIPVCSTLTSRTVSWRGNGNGDPSSSEYAPKVFALSAGSHQLIIRGREAGTSLGAITIASKPPRLRIGGLTSGASMVNGVLPPPAGALTILSATGEPGQVYQVQCSEDLKTWTGIGMLTLDESGEGQFIDLAGSGGPNCVYRLQGQ